MTKDERLQWQREYRKRTNNACTAKYEKTKRGFLMRCYRNMLSRITGVQVAKYHLYEGKRLDFTKQEFYEFSLGSDVFNKLFAEWELSEYNRKLTPSVDRINSAKGYSFDNIEWVTHSENSARSSAQRRKKNTLYSRCPSSEGCAA